MKTNERNEEVELRATKILEMRGITYAGFGEWIDEDGKRMMSQTATALLQAIHRREAAE